MKASLFFAFSLLAVASALLADEPQRIELAARLVKAMRIADRNHAPVSDAFPKLKEANPQADEFWQALASENTKLYAEAFSADELQQLVTFFESPIGQSFVTKQRDLGIKSRQLDVERLMKLLNQAK